MHISCGVFPDHAETPYESGTEKIKKWIGMSFLASCAADIACPRWPSLFIDVTLNMFIFPWYFPKEVTINVWKMIEMSHGFYWFFWY